MDLARRRGRDLTLFAILARDAPAAVVFRRGPSKRVLLISWNLRDDTFEAGQWLKGRIYERRCDLSPDGRYLIYFAANWKRPYQSWTAVSRPPFLTALALWPKGDAWGGGGLFKTTKHILLNHRKEASDLAPDCRPLPNWLKVEPLGALSGRGEDDPIWTQRLQRDGWTQVRAGKPSMDRKRAIWITFEPPLMWEKPHPSSPGRVLRMSIEGIKEKDGPWYVMTHEVIEGDHTTSLGRTEWADWASDGDLLFAKGNRLYRGDRMIVDFSDRTFRELPAPDWAKRWK